MSTANGNTHFLDSPSLRSCLEKSTFDFANLKSDDNPITVYLVIPADRLETHGRWLRLIVSIAIDAMSRTEGKPKTPALFLLDEFAALGRLVTIERAFGLMAGFGMRIWAIVQDLSQPQDLYKNRWQTFIANAGILQVFGTSDLNTAEYISRTLGQTTIEQISQGTADKRNGGMFSAGNPNYRNMNDRTFGRALMTPDEIMKMPLHDQLILPSGTNPIYCEKRPYWDNARYYGYDENWDYGPLYTQHPDQPQYDPNGEHDPIETDQETRDRMAVEIDGFYKAHPDKAKRDGYKVSKDDTPARKRFLGLF